MQGDARQEPGQEQEAAEKQADHPEEQEAKQRGLRSQQSAAHAERHQQVGRRIEDVPITVPLQQKRQVPEEQVTSAIPASGQRPEPQKDIWRGAEEDSISQHAVDIAPGELRSCRLHGSISQHLPASDFQFWG